MIVLTNIDEKEFKHGSVENAETSLILDDFQIASFPPQVSLTSANANGDCQTITVDLKKVR